MNRSLAIVVTLASGMALSAAAQSLSAPASAPAAVTAPAGPAKIAVIAFQVAVAQTNEGQRNYAELEKKFAPREAKAKALNDEIENLTKQLQTQGATLQDAERVTRLKTIDDKKKELERMTEDLRTDGNQDIQQMYQTLASKVFDVMSTYATQNGFTMVLDMSQQQGTVLYADPSLDITKPVINAYNAKSGVPAPPPALPSAPRPAGAPAH
ncbi:MAG: OmpH family outer membrane protein [Terracidiphilus sp.]|jgi:outer membrane protein